MTSGRSLRCKSLTPAPLHQDGEGRQHTDPEEQTFFIDVLVQKVEIKITALPPSLLERDKRVEAYKRLTCKL
jgi:hypothetical protein